MLAIARLRDAFSVNLRTKKYIGIEKLKELRISKLGGPASETYLKFYSSENL